MNGQIMKDALSIWKIICTFMNDYSVKNLYLRYYFSGDMWLLEAINPDDFIWLVEDFSEYIPELLDEITKIAKEHKVKCSEIFDDKYKQINLIF